MIEINLLPKELRKRSHGLRLPKTAWYVTVSVAALVVLVIGLTGVQRYQLRTWNKRISQVKKQVALMKQDIQMVDALMEVKQKIVDRLSAIEELDRNRTSHIVMFEDLARRVPEYLWLTSFKEGKTVQLGELSLQPVSNPGSPVPAGKSQPAPTSTGQRTKIEGFAYSLNSIATFMIQMKKSNFFKNVELEFAREQSLENRPVYNFQLTCDLQLVSSTPIEPTTAGALTAAGSR